MNSIIKLRQEGEERERESGDFLARGLVNKKISYWFNWEIIQMSRMHLKHSRLNENLEIQCSRKMELW